MRNSMLQVPCQTITPDHLYVYRYMNDYTDGDKEVRYFMDACLNTHTHTHM